MHPHRTANYSNSVQGVIRIITDITLGEGFEPSLPVGKTVFKTAAFSQTQPSQQDAPGKIRTSAPHEEI